MIEYISGKLIKKNTDSIIIDVNGLGYKLYIMTQLKKIR